MTIIEPNKNKSKIKLFIALISVIILIGSFFSIQIYNTNVNLKHTLAREGKKLEQLEVINAELKNRLYGILDDNNLRIRTQDLGLILEKNPAYLETDIQVAATNPWIFGWFSLLRHFLYYSRR